MSGVRAVGGAGSSRKLQYDLLRCESWARIVGVPAEPWVSPLKKRRSKPWQ